MASRGSPSRLVSRSTLGAESQEMEVAGLGVVEDGKLSEWHEVADLEADHRRRTQTGKEAASG